VKGGIGSSPKVRFASVNFAAVGYQNAGDLRAIFVVWGLGDGRFR